MPLFWLTGVASGGSIEHWSALGVIFGDKRRVVGRVTSSGVHPGDSRGDCHTEHFGENDGGDFAGKLLLSSAARSSSIDPERARRWPR